MRQAGVCTGLSVAPDLLSHPGSSNEWQCREVPGKAQSLANKPLTFVVGRGIVRVCRREDAHRWA